MSFLVQIYVEQTLSISVYILLNMFLVIPSKRSQVLLKRKNHLYPLLRRLLPVQDIKSKITSSWDTYILYCHWILINNYHSSDIWQNPIVNDIKLDLVKVEKIV